MVRAGARAVSASRAGLQLTLRSPHAATASVTPARPFWLEGEPALPAPLLTVHHHHFAFVAEYLEHNLFFSSPKVGVLGCEPRIRAESLKVRARI